MMEKCESPFWTTVLSGVLTLTDIFMLYREDLKSKGIYFDKSYDFLEKVNV